MNITQVKKRLDAAYEKYCAEVEAIGLQLLEERVKPFCRERGAQFVSGMGGYSVWVAGADKLHDRKTYDEDTAKSDKKWHSLRECLDLQIDGLNSNCLGSYMRDFKQ